MSFVATKKFVGSFYVYGNEDGYIAGRIVNLDNQDDVDLLESGEHYLSREQAQNADKAYSIDLAQDDEGAIYAICGKYKSEKPKKSAKPKLTKSAKPKLTKSAEPDKDEKPVIASTDDDPKDISF